MDPGTGLSILGTAVGSAKVLEKILGPTAEYLGQGLREWTERSTANVGKVFGKAKEKLGSKIETDGAVPPKVLKGILEEAPFCDDELAAEYFGGVLASSRSPVSRDDRGAAMIALVGRLSTYQIRTHFFFYHVLKALFDGGGFGVLTGEQRQQLQTFIPFSGFVSALEFGPGEDINVILNHVMFGLHRETLIEGEFRYGPKEDISARFAAAQEGGVIFQPSALGVELLHWAHGQGDVPISRFLEPSVQFKSDVKIRTSAGIAATRMPGRELFTQEASQPQ